MVKRTADGKNRYWSKNLNGNAQVSKITQNFTIIQHRRFGNYSLNSLAKRFQMDRAALTKVLGNSAIANSRAHSKLASNDIETLKFQIIYDCAARWFELQIYKGTPVSTENLDRIVQEMLVNMFEVEKADDIVKLKVIQNCHVELTQREFEILKSEDKFSVLKDEPKTRYSI